MHMLLRGSTAARRCFSSSISPMRSLISDPLRPERIAKSQSDDLFPLPHYVSFDLWDTIYTPRKPIPEQYYDISHNEFHLDKLVESIKHDFVKIHAEMLKKYPNYGKTSDHIGSSDQWWKELIVQVYGLPHYSQDGESDRLCERLLQHFSSSEAYVLYDDAVPVLEALTKSNVPIVASTNSDDRVYPILESLGVDHYFSSVNLSYDLGCSKPDRKFYNRIFHERFDAAKRADPSLQMSSYLERVWHVGDDYDKDFVGSIKAGWNGVLLDRAKTSLFMGHNTPKAISNDCFEGQSCNGLESDDIVMIANNRVCVSGLRPVLSLFGIESS